MHLVRRGHFPSRDKDGGDTIESDIPEKPMLHANLMALSFREPELWAIKVYTAEIGTVDLVCSCDLDPMTFIYELDRIACRYIGCANTNLLRHGFRKLSSDIDIDRQTRYAWSLLVT